MPGDVQAVSLQAAGVNFIRHLAEFSPNAIDSTDFSRVELDTIDTAYCQNLSAFNAFMCGITQFVFSINDIQILADDTHTSIHTLRWCSVH